LKRLRMTWIVGVCVVSLGAFVACTRGDGETCQVPSDCEDGLTCCRAVGDAPRGWCHKKDSAACSNAAITDAGGSTPDAGHDAGHDASMSLPADDGG
jgi:hypothetical protein